MGWCHPHSEHIFPLSQSSLEVSSRQAQTCISKVTLKSGQVDKDSKFGEDPEVFFLRLLAISAWS